MWKARGNATSTTSVTTSDHDVNAVALHISLNWDVVSAMYVQHHLGMEPKGQC